MGAEKPKKNNGPRGTQLFDLSPDNVAMKPIVLKHNVLTESSEERAPIVITWDGLVMPQELHKVRPGQYVLLPYVPPPEEPPPPSRLAA